MSHFARHLRSEIYEVRAEGARGSYRLLFAPEGKKGRILLALEAISKKNSANARPNHRVGRGKAERMASSCQAAISLMIS